MLQGRSTTKGQKECYTLGSGTEIFTMTTALRPQFWKHYPLDALNTAEWEALCDGCGLCCLIKLEDEDTHEIAYTQVACKLLDCNTARCSDYENRQAACPTVFN